MRILTPCLIMVGILVWPGMGSAATPSMPVEVIFNEPFEDQNWESRGWYDYAEGGNTLPLVNDGAVGGSTQSVEYAWAQGATTPTNTGTIRLALTPTDNIYVSYWVKYSTGYQGSGTTFHPHEFQMLTNKSGAYSGFNNQPLSLLIEQGDGGVGGTLLPRLAFANPANVNGVYYDGTNAITTNIWHKVEVFMKLNTFTGTVGNTDGIFRYWLDGSLEVEATNIMMRDGAANTDMLINQFAIPPYIGVGSPIAQTMWVDELTIGTENGAIPNAPSSISVN